MRINKSRLDQCFKGGGVSDAPMLTWLELDHFVTYLVKEASLVDCQRKFLDGRGQRLRR